MSTSRPSNRTISYYVVAIVGAFLIMFVLVRAMQHYMRAPNVTQNRAEERRKARIALQAANTEALESPAGWVDKSKGIVRLPLTRAMELTLQEWKTNAAGARSNLIMRVEKRDFVPPKPPEKPNIYE